MPASIESIRKNYDCDALYDLTPLVQQYRNLEHESNNHEQRGQHDYWSPPYEWQYFYSILFPDRQYVGLWIGHAYASKFIQIPLDRFNKDESRYAYSLYGPLEFLAYQNGKRVPGSRVSYRAGAARLRILHKVVQGDWVKAVFDADKSDYEHTAELKYIPASFNELNLQEARQFTKQEADFIHEYSLGAEFIEAT